MTSSSTPPCSLRMRTRSTPNMPHAVLRSREALPTRPGTRANSS